MNKNQAQTERQPGHMTIRGGVILAALGVILYVMAIASGGSGNPVLMVGMLVIGIMIAGLGYLQRIANRRH